MLKSTLEGHMTWSGKGEMGVDETEEGSSEAYYLY